MSTLSINLSNTTSSSSVYAYITGQAIDNNNALFLLESDARTPYYPSSPSTTGAALAVNCAIALGAPGHTVMATIPHIAGGRIWFSVGQPLTFLLNPGPGLVEPSVTNPSDPNINIQWDFCEFTFNSSQLYANITYVDFVSLPIGLTLASTSGGTSQTVTGMASNGLDTVCSNLQAQQETDNAGWSSLIVTAPSGGNLRALSPNDGIIIQPGLFANYWASYVNAVWSKYSSTTLTVDTQIQYGKVAGTVSNNSLNFPGESFSQPSSGDIFSNSTGAFAPSSDIERGDIIARLCAAFNRSTLLVDTLTPDPNEGTSQYYSDAVTNHYARIVHAANADGRGYAFPFDDVAPTGGEDQSGFVSSGDPALLTVVVGGGNA